jgi:hypothetical protein
MRCIRALPLIAAIASLPGCAPALREPPPVADLGRAAPRASIETPAASDVDRVLAEAGAAWARRPDAAAVNDASASSAAARMRRGSTGCSPRCDSI